MENSNEERENKVIVLNAMYSGGYLKDNMGHEIINLFKADDPVEIKKEFYQNFIYLNPYGNFNSAYKGRIKDMLMVISVPKKNIFEVVGKATDLVDIYEPVKGFNPKSDNTEDIKNSQITKLKDLKYGDKSLFDLFDNDQQQAIFVTFAAKSVCRPKKRLFIKFLPPEEYGKTIEKPRMVSNEDRCEILLVSSQKAKQSQKQYFDAGRKDSDENEDVYWLNQILNDPDNWYSADDNEKGVTTAKPLKCKELTFNKDSLFNICKIGDNELAFSNALAFYIEKYPHLFSKFFDLRINESNNKEKIIIEREWNHIDIYLKMGDQRRIIENKIHSGINCSNKETAENAKKKDGDKKESQLGRCWNAVSQELNIEDESKEDEYIKAYLLCPNYKKYELENGENKKDNFEYGYKYTIITYSELHESLIKSTEYLNKANPDRNFQDFVNALKKHTYKSIPELKYAEMEDQFKTRINNNI